MSRPAFWQDKERAAETTVAFESKSKFLRRLEKTDQAVNQLPSELEKAHKTPAKEKELALVEREIEQFERERLMQGKWDERSAYLSLHTGAGGVDAADFSRMLLEMYLKFAQRHNFKTTILSESPHQEAGIKSALIRVEGAFAYGYLKSEAGVHRLIRLSPFNAQNLRQTSFTLVDVLPDLGEVQVKLAEKDLKIETFRASSHGGQSVNTTDSAVRITHLPTGITVAVQNERSQMQNKETALKILKMRLKHHLEQEKKDKEATLRTKGEAEFGHQIRSYVLHPYKQVKDHRSGFETGRVDAVLGGDLDEVIESVLIKAG